MFQIQKLSKQNKQLKNKIRNIDSELRCAKNDCEVQKMLVKKAKQQYNQLVFEIKELKRREQDKKIQKQEMETRYYNVLHKLEQEIQERKQKYHKLQAKINPLMDPDSVKLQILNEVEGRHSMETEELKGKINQLKDQVLRLKRENYRLEHRIDEKKIQHDNQIRKARSLVAKNQENHHLDCLTFQMCSQMENRLLLNYQQARKQAEHYKDKYFTTEKKYLERMNNLQLEVGLLKDKCRFYEKRNQG